MNNNHTKPIQKSHKNQRLQGTPKIPNSIQCYCRRRCCCCRRRCHGCFVSYRPGSDASPGGQRRNMGRSHLGVEPKMGMVFPPNGMICGGFTLYFWKHLFLVHDGNDTQTQLWSNKNGSANISPQQVSTWSKAQLFWRSWSSCPTSPAKETVKKQAYETTCCLTCTGKRIYINTDHDQGYVTCTFFVNIDSSSCQPAHPKTLDVFGHAEIKRTFGHLERTRGTHIRILLASTIYLHNTQDTQVHTHW